jgi:UDP-glucuronate decarboxylase
MNVLVTGAAGFLGSHLVDRLLKDGHVVYGMDNLYTGSLDNLKDSLNHPNFHFDPHDITKPLTLLADIDLIFNMACPASPVHYQKDPVYTWKTSVFGIYNVLEFARTKKNCRVVQASTSEVYGDPLIHPQHETYFGNVNPIGIRSCYDEGKRAAEALMFDYQRHYQLNTGVFRIFNTYGPRMAVNDGRVVSNFIVAVLKNEPIEIYGDGSQTRSFCYVDDLIEGIVKFAFSNETGPINLGNPGEFTIGELASIIVGKIGGQVVYKPSPADDPKQRKPIIDLANSKLSWQPEIKLTNGLDKTIEYFREKVSS